MYPKNELSRFHSPRGELELDSYFCAVNCVSRVSGKVFFGASFFSAKPQNVTVEVNVVPHGDGGAPDLNGPLHGFKDG